jgi:hypothetical protein
MLNQLIAWLKALLFGSPHPNIRISKNVPWSRVSIEAVVRIVLDGRVPFEDFGCHIRMGSPMHKGKACGGWTDGYLVMLDKYRVDCLLSETALIHEIEHIVRSMLSPTSWRNHDAAFFAHVERATLAARERCL